jgi:hypothetical protein
MNVEVRWAQTTDAAELAALFREMAVHYRQPEIPAE